MVLKELIYNIIFGVVGVLKELILTGFNLGECGHLEKN